MMTVALLVLPPVITLGATAIKNAGAVTAIFKAFQSLVNAIA